MLRHLFRRRLFSYPTKYYILVLVLSLITFSVLRIHQKSEFVSVRHLELAGDDPYSNVNCTKILQGDPEEIQKVKLEILTVHFKKRPRWTPQDYINMTHDCASFMRTRKYIVEPQRTRDRRPPVSILADSRSTVAMVTTKLVSLHFLTSTQHCQCHGVKLLKVVLLRVPRKNVATNPRMPSSGQGVQCPEGACSSSSDSQT